MEYQSLGFIGGGRITAKFLEVFANKHINFSSLKLASRILTLYW